MTAALGLQKHLRHIKDPRIERNKLHQLIDIISIGICAVIGNANTWQEVVLFAQLRIGWFERFLALPNGIPSHDTFERVFDRLNPRVLQKALLGWLHDLSELVGVKHIAIDGKSLRHSGGGRSSLRQLHLVSAWATEANLTLGQVATEEKSNEITAIPHLLQMLDIKGALVTIDAMGCQKGIAKQIVDQGGDYALFVKDNQPQLKEDIQTRFEKAYETECKDVQYDWHETEEKGHGRHEKRMYEVIYAPEGIRNEESWEKLTVIGKCYCERTVNGKTSCEERYFIGSSRCSAKRYGEVLRQHWAIENGLHWQMDVTFGEDASRILKRHGGENFALLRRLALGLLKQHPSKNSIRCKRYQAAIDLQFLEAVLKGNPNIGKLK